MRAAFGWALVALFFAVSAEAAGPKRVLILHSFGRDFAPYDAIASVFRTDLARRSPEPITFVEANLDFRRAINDKEERAFLEYLSARFDDAPPDVVVTLGPPAARFYVRHRAELFRDTPMIMGALDERLVQQVGLLPNDAVVVGASELERFWLGELQRELAPFTRRVKFEWLNDLSLAQMQARVATLPPHSAVFYGLLIVDAAGVPHERHDALASLRAAANAPIFGLYESELGLGVVGGPYSSQRTNGERIATAALRALGASTESRSQIDIAGFEAPVYDWRELERWNIDHGRLPPGSEIRFRPPTLWEEHRIAIVATAAALGLQTILIAGLLWQRVRRRHAEREAQSLGGRLITAHEDERRRLARELHDDVTQRLAGLAIDAARAEGGTGDPATQGVARSIRTGLIDLSEDVHALSYRLHPSVIEDLGLVEALRAECERVARPGPLRVDLDSQSVPRQLPSDASICIFRIAQEALRNVVRHAQATNVKVSLLAKDGGIELAVRDNGTGFEAARKGDRTSLGLASMRERVRLLGGRLDIESAARQGTSVVAWVPVKEAA